MTPKIWKWNFSSLILHFWGHFALGDSSHCSQVLSWQPCVMNVSPNGKVKKLVYLAGYWLDLAQIWYRGEFLDSESKSNNKFLHDIILTSKWRKDKIPLYRLWKMRMTSLWRHFCPIFLKTSTYLLFKKDYNYSKFGLVWISESKVMEKGGRGSGFRPPLSRLKMY